MNGKDLAYCSGCDHLSRKTCDYLIHVGHSRGCPPGVGCPLHTKKKEKMPDKQKTGRKPPNTAPLDELRAMQLYNEGLDDIAMADALGVTAKRVQNWRLRMHLKRPKGKSAKRCQRQREQADFEEAAGELPAKAGEATFAATVGGEKEMEQAAEEVSFHQVVKQPETAETPGAAASENTQEEREPMTAETMLQICERIVGAGLGHLPLRIDGRDVRDFLVIALVKTPDGAIIEMTN